MTTSPKNPAQEFKHDVKDMVSDLSINYFSSFIEHNCPKSWGNIPTPRKLELSQELLKQSQVQRILCDMGTRLETFMLQQMKYNPGQLRDFLFKGSLLSFQDPAHQKHISYRPGTATPVFLESKKSTSPMARNYSSGGKRNLDAVTNLKTPDKRAVSEEKTAFSRRKVRENENKKKGEKEKQVSVVEPPQKNPYEIYFRSDLGQNFIQTVGKTEQIRENLANFTAELDEQVTEEISKTKANWKEVEELFATKQRVMNILEEIIDKEYVSTEELIGRVEDNWDLTEEYERYIADLTAEYQKEKDALVKRFENRIYSMKENFGHLLSEIESELENRKTEFRVKESNYLSLIQIKDSEIETLVGNITLLQTQVYKLEERMKSRTRQANHAPSKMSKDSSSQRNSEFTRKIDTQRSKKTMLTNTKSKMNSANRTSKNPNTSRPPHPNNIKIIQNIEVLQKSSTFMNPDHMLDVTSINDDERSRLSVSSHDISQQHMASISRRVSEDFDNDDDKRKTKRLKEFFLKLYERMMAKKSGAYDSKNSVDGGSDDEGGNEEWGAEIYEIVSRNMANSELCEAAGVKPIDESNLLKKPSLSSFRKKTSSLLFQRKKKPNFNFEVIPENLKEENEKPEVMIFDSCKEELLEFIEGISHQELTVEVKELPMPKLFEQEVTLPLDKLLTVDDFKEDGEVPQTEYVVTIEQLIMNTLNFYMDLLGERTNIIKMFKQGRTIAKKVWKHAQTDNIDLQKVIVQAHQEVQVEIIPPSPIIPNQMGRSTDTPLLQHHPHPLSDHEADPTPMKILQDSLTSWKKRLEQVRGNSGQKISSQRSSDWNSPRHMNNASINDVGYRPKTPAEMLHLRLKGKMPGSSFHESEKKAGPESNDAEPKAFFYETATWKMEDLEKERSVWRNILADELFPKFRPIGSMRMLDGEFSVPLTNKQQYPGSVAVKYLQAPMKEQMVDKRNEIRRKIEVGKSKFTSFKEERMKLEQQTEKPKQRNEGEMGRMLLDEAESPMKNNNSEDINELCKRTVMALYDYIVNVQKDLVNPAKLKAELSDVNKKVSEIEEMLQVGLADRKYTNLLNHFRQREFRKGGGSKQEIREYLEGKRNEMRENVKNALESKLIPAFRNSNRSTQNQAPVPKEIRSSSVKPTPSKRTRPGDDIKMPIPPSISSESKIEGFDKDENDLSISQFVFDPTGEKKHSPPLSIHSHRGLSPRKENFFEEGSQEQDPRNLSVAGIEKEDSKGETPHTVSGSVYRDQILHKLSIANAEVAKSRQKSIDRGASKGREQGSSKKATFKVKKLSLPKEKVTNALNNTIL